MRACESRVDAIRRPLRMGDAREERGFVRLALGLARQLSFHAPKSQRIVDYRLALLKLSLDAGIVVYLVWSLFSDKAWLRQEVPFGFIGSYADVTSDFAALQAATKANAGEATTLGGAPVLPCRHASLKTTHDFNYGSGWMYNETVCAYLGPGEMLKKQLNQRGVFLTTHIDQKYYYRERQQGSQCDGTHTTAAATSDGATSTFRLDSSSADTGVCQYRMQKNLLTVGVDETKIVIMHSFKGTLLGNHPQRTPAVSVRYSERPDVELAKIEQNQRIELTLKEMVRFLEMDLDKPFHQQPGDKHAENLALETLYGEGFSAGTTPTPRVAGFTIEATLEYYNFKLDPYHDNSGFSLDVGKKTPYAILKLKPSLEWTSAGFDFAYRPDESNDINQPFNLTGTEVSGSGYYVDSYRQGIYIDLKSVGVVGHFNGPYLITILVSSAVMLALSSRIVYLVACYTPSVRSTVFRRSVQESLDFERVCSSYVLQALLAASMFRKRDLQQNGVLTADDIRSWLRDCLSEEVFSESRNAKFASQTKVFKRPVRGLSEEEINSLVFFIMRSADRQSQARYRKGGHKLRYHEVENQTISIHEFIELFSPDVLDVNLLRDTIKTINKENENEEWLENAIGSA